MRFIALFSTLLSGLLLMGQPLVGQNLSQAVRLYESKKYDQAFSQFNSITKGDTQYAESRYYMGLISIQKSDQTKAEEYLKQAISANGGVAKYHLAMATLLGQTIREANVIKQASLASRIKTHLETAVKLDPKDMNASYILIGLYMRAPKIMGGDPEKAKKVAADMLKYNRAEGFRAQGFIAQSEERFTEAESNYRNALNASPDSLKYYSSLGSFYQSRSQFDLAFAVYEKAIEKFPESRNLLLQAGRMVSMSDMKNREKGIKYLNLYINGSTDKKDKSIGNAWYYLGLIEKNNKNLSLARNHFNAALNINPEHRQAKQALSEMN